MILKILHRTTYLYETSVQGSFNEVRLRPINTEYQKRHSFDIRVEPRVNISEYKDFYGNAVCYFEISNPHQSLVIETNSLVETLKDEREAPRSGMLMENYDALNNSEFLQDFIFSSKYIDVERADWNLAKDIIGGNIKDLWHDIIHLSEWINDNFTYDSEATEVHTHSRECLQLRRGVCQDYAHILIGFYRFLKIPARYVSGYLYEDSDCSKYGVDRASHAWVEVYLPEHGWVGIDPTHRCVIDTRYVKVAVGRDYFDIRPVSGTYMGAPSRTLDVHVQISELPSSGITST